MIFKWKFTTGIYKGKRKKFIEIEKKIHLKAYPIFEQLYKIIHDCVLAKYTESELEDINKGLVAKDPLNNFLKRVPIIVGQYFAMLEAAKEPINIKFWYNKERITCYFNLIKKMGRKAKIIRNNWWIEVGLCSFG